MINKPHLLKGVSALFFVSLTLFLSGCTSPEIKSVREVESPESIVYETTKMKIQNARFVPEKITVKLGSEVTFTNLDDQSYIIASDPHPEHTDLQDLYSPPIYTGKSYKYVFSKEGYFGVHLEENPSIKGQIIVTLPEGENEGTNNDNK